MSKLAASFPSSSPESNPDNVKQGFVGGSGRCWCWRSYGKAWRELINATESTATRRQEFSKLLHRTQSELSGVVKDSDRSRKQLRDSDLKLYKQLTELEHAVAKVTIYWTNNWIK